MRSSLLLTFFAGAAAASPSPFPVSGGSHWQQSSGLYFKPGDGLVAQSAQGDFQLGLGARMQLRYTARPDADQAHQLSVRRLRLNLRGHTFGRDNTFRIQLALSPEDLGQGQAVEHAPMLDAFVRFRQVRDLNIQVGQFKVPFSRLRIASSGDLMFVDRPLAEGQFTLDRDLGVVVRSDDFLGADLLSYVLGVFQGQGRNGAAAFEATPLLLGRISLRPFGQFDEYSEPDLDREQSPKLALGAGFAHHRGAHGARGNVDFDPAAAERTINHATADLVFKWSGWSVHGGFYWRDTLKSDGADADGTGVYAATGLVFPRHPLDLAVRYSQTRPADDQSSVLEVNEFTTAMSWYMAAHFLKLSVDYSRFWDDTGFGEGEDQIRIQLQTQL